jgi:hypothetical protein
VNVRPREWRDGDAAVVLAAFQAPDLRRQAAFPVVTRTDRAGADRLVGRVWSPADRAPARSLADR